MPLGFKVRFDIIAASIDSMEIRMQLSKLTQDQPKWFRDDRDLQVGDVVLILKHDSEISSNYQYGMIDSIEVGRDLKVRKIHVRYRNANQEIDYVTFRSARSIVVIHPVDEINIMQHIGRIAMEVDREKRNARQWLNGGGV